MSLVIKETYKVMRTTPRDLDPCTVIQPFHSLNKGQYQLLAKFPQRVKVYNCLITKVVYNQVILLWFICVVLGQ